MMKLRKDKSNVNMFWFGKKNYQWVVIEFPISEIIKNIIYTIGGNYEVLPDPMTEVRVMKIPYKSNRVKRFLRLFSITGITRIKRMVYIYFKNSIWKVGFENG